MAGPTTVQVPRGTHVLVLAKRKQEFLDKLREGMSVSNAAKAIGIGPSAVYRDPAVMREVEEVRRQRPVVSPRRGTPESPSYDLIPYSRGMYLLVFRDGKRTLSFLGTPVRLTPDMEVSRNGR